MPARNEFGNQTKKKKGRAPAHQNKFAFKHNPCSKKTEKILGLKNIHVCQRCSDKIEWRKKYRKYKPRTQPGTCNECRRRNVMAAYHTICEKCTTDSVKAKALVKELTGAESSGGDNDEGPQQQQQQQKNVRACAVCVKELALPDPEEEEDDRDYIDAMSRLKLRERRALERKLAKEQQEAEEEARRRRTGEDGSDDDEGDDEGSAHQGSESLDPLAEEDASREDDDSVPDYGDEADDPFLKAIGGADKLLTGEAYRQKLLQQQQQQQQS